MYVVDFHYFINSLFSIDSGYSTKRHILHAFIIEYQLQGGGGGGGGVNGLKCNGKEENVTD